MKKTKTSPPGAAIRFLEWFCPDFLFEGIEGDLMQQFDSDVETFGIAAAKRKFFWNTLRFFRLEIISRNRFSFEITNAIMIRNYVKVAVRNIAKRKMYSFINAFGLSIGLAFCMLIYLFILDENSFDQFHENKSTIYRLEEKSYDSWQQDSLHPYNYSAYLPLPLLNALKDELPEVQFATHFNPDYTGAMKYGDKVFTESFALVDADFFKMFSFELLSGSRDKLFDTKGEIVLTPQIAAKYFGDEDPVGKTVSLFINGERNFTVAAVIQSPPGNSSLDFKMLVPMQNHPAYERNINSWGNFGYPSFIQVLNNVDTSRLAAKFDQVITKYMGSKLEEWRKEGNAPGDVKMFELDFTALSDIHLNKKISWHKVSDSQYSLILGGIALLILVIACINYISLALTTSASRRIEVGVRKVAGAQRMQLTYQFAFESIVLALISMIISFGLVILFLPFFNEYTGKSISINGYNFLVFGLGGLMLTVLVGVLAGSYPSFFLAGFKPALVLKGGFTSRLHAGFTKPLVVVQFALSAFLIISSVIMFRQMRYITSKNLGYDRDQILVVPTQSGWDAASDKVVSQFRDRLNQEAFVLSVGGTSISFNQGYSRYGYKIEGEQKSAYVYSVDPYYISTLGLKLVDGRNFDAAMFQDSSAVIVNEALVKDMKWKEPLGEYLNFTEDSVGQGHKVIGVLKDYHFLSLEKSIEPLFLSMDMKNAGHLTTMLVKVNAASLPANIDKLRSVWKELFPNKPFDYTFLDEDVARQYESYKRWMNIMVLATGFAILIACLGLFGLSGINAMNRTKEIGIRKVMGAELTSIFILLNKQYIYLAFVAFAIAAPLSWYIMTKWWLVDFQFRIEVGWELFVMSISGGLAIALLTVSYHSIKAASTNPAHTLKCE
jgi:putative ABC transport system permease protein